MSLIKIEPALRDVIQGLGSDPEMEAVKIFHIQDRQKRAYRFSKRYDQGGKEKI